VGHRFNANKLLIDPYARQLVGELSWGPELFGYRLDHRDKDLSFDKRDSAALMQKCHVIDPSFLWGAAQKPDVPWERTIIYEMHVKGFTKLHPLVPEADRGTFAGLADPSVPAYLRSLGITSAELLPIHAFVDDNYLIEKGLELLGIQFAGLFRTRATLFAIAIRERIQGYGQSISRARDRSHS
jgi:glycogen operon protein